MTQESHYLAAVLPAPVRVLGVRLQPFCIGHALLLQRLGNPFYVGGSVPALGDLLLGVSLCALPPAEAVRQIDSWPFLLRLRLRSWWWSLRYPRTALAEPMIQFSRYLQAALKMPTYWREEDKSNPSSPGTPWLQRVLLIVQLYRTQAESLATPMAEALWIYCAHWEQQGVIRVFGEADQELLEAAEALAKENAQAKAA
jgi:hypothetical protein